MKKWLIGVLLLFAAFAVTVPAGLYAGGWVFIKLAEVPDTMLNLYTLQQYNAAYGHIPGIRKLIKIGQFIAGIIAVLPAIIGIALFILSREKRELHGSSRFANAGEIAKFGLIKKKFKPKDAPDLLIGKYGSQYLRWAGNEFLYVAAPTRSGKGAGLVIPNCLHYRDSMVVYDPKLENYLITSGYRASRGQQVFLFNPSGQMPEHVRNPNAPLSSHRWNPCTYIRRNPVYTYKDIKIIAGIMYPKPAKDSGSATFFQESAQNLFAGLLMYMVETENERDLSLQENKTTLANLFRLTTPKSGQTLGEWIKDEIELRDMQPHTALSPNCRSLLQGFANGNAKTGADILATLIAPLGIFIDPVVEAATSGDDFYLDDVRKKHMTIYVGVVPTETGIFSRLTNLFFSQLVSINVQQGLPVNNPDALKYQCCLLMDEFAALGVIPAIQHGVSYLAGYEMRLMIAIQTPSQMTEIYGKEAMRTFFTNFGCQIVFSPREQNDAEEYSKLIGYETFKARSVSRSSGKGSSRSQSTSDQRRAVMTPDELKLMPNSDCIISLNNSRPIYATKITYWTDPVFAKRANMALPVIPALDVHVHRKAIGAAPKAEYIPPEELAETDWRDTANADEIARSILASLIPPGSPPEYVAALVPVVAKNWGEGSLTMITKMLGETVNAA